MPLRDELRTALVTGASSGLGAAFVDMLLAEGVEVWGTSRSSNRLPSRERFHGVALELSDADSVDRAWSEAEHDSHGIDLLVSGAGVFGAFVETESSTWEAQIEVLLEGPARLSRHALPLMLARGRGCIVNVSSLAAEFPIPHMSAYNTAKAGLSALSCSLDLETAGSSVRVIDFRPGDYRTAFNRNMLAHPIPTGSTAQARVWHRLESILHRAPEPSRAARDLRMALVAGRRGVVRSGGLFQACVAPFLNRFAPLRLSRWVQRRYFHLD